MAMRLIPWILRRPFNAFQRPSTLVNVSHSRANKRRPKSPFGRLKMTG
jgi:hypothetical protein